MTMKLAESYDLRVPRYTSYPTAPHFSGTLGAETYAAWLGGLSRAEDLSLYFHIPFCDSMCWFCGCYTKIVKKYKPIGDYLNVLIKEIDLVAAHVAKDVLVKHLHWGGGSPTMLTGADWMKTVARIRDRFNLSENAEIAVEMDPRDTVENYVRDLAVAGVNRVSIGVQDFHAEVQSAINRDQPFDVTQRVVGWLADYGIENLNMDLMYGLPHQTAGRVVEMVDLAVKLRPQRVALFGYAHVPWMRAHQKLIDEADLPGAAERWEQSRAASERLIEAGYLAVGLDHFARPDDSLAMALREGKLHRNFQGYTADGAPVLLGMGASAIGSLRQGYVQNASPLRDYARAIEAGHFATVRGIELSAEDKMRATIIERLMCDLRVDPSEIAGNAGLSISFDDEISRLARFETDGMISILGTDISVTERGRPFVRLVASVFDTYLQTGKARHSRAV